MSQAALVDLVLRAAEDAGGAGELRIAFERGGEAPLYGAEGPLDSLALVTLVLAVEDRVRAEVGAVVTLADERALAQERSPFRTVGSLASYLGELLARAP